MKRATIKQIEGIVVLALIVVSLAIVARCQMVAGGDRLQIGPNIVTVTARHCQKYRLHGFATALLVDSKACAADPSTEFYRYQDHNLKTNSGVDYISGQISGSGGTATAQWIGLSTSSSAVNATDTSLPSEITTNGLGRAQGTYAHTNGTTTYTVTYLFTATGAQSGIWKAGLLTAAYPSGTLVNEFLLGASVNLNSGDQLSAQWTITIS